MTASRAGPSRKAGRMVRRRSCDASSLCRGYETHPAERLKTVPLNFFLVVNCYIYYENMSRINNQFSVGVHIMTALRGHHGEQVTSAHLSASVRAHDSQVRSVLSKLVIAGLVVTSRGRNGYSSLSRPAALLVAI